MSSVLIRNARIVSPDEEPRTGSVRVENGIITSVGDVEETGTEARIDAAGRMLVPGFIDIHSHGADGSNLDGSVATLAHIARAKLREGVTTWLPTTLTLPHRELLAVARAVAAFRESGPPLRCPGLHLEGPFINPERAGAQNPAHVRPPSIDELDELHAICPVVQLSLAPEIPGALELIRNARKLGITCSAAHTSATAAEIRQAVDAGLTQLTHFGNAMSPLHHREIGAVGEGLANRSLMLEIIADGVHLSADMLRLVCGLVPAERLMLITDSTAGSWMEDGEFELGGCRVEIRQGVARLASSGDLAGSTLRYHHGLRNLVEATGLPLHELIRTTSLNQAKSLGLGDFGRVSPGNHADLVLLNEDFSVWKCIVGGKVR